KQIDNLIESFFPTWILSRQRDRLGINVSARFIEKESQVINYFAQIFERDWKDKIRSVVYGAVKSPPDLGKLIVSHLKKLKSQELLATFAVVIYVVSPKISSSSSFTKRLNERISFFEENDVRDRLDLNLRETTKSDGMDLVIIDDKHLVFIISELGRDTVY